MFYHAPSGQCVQQCPVGFIGMFDRGVCQACEYIIIRTEGMYLFHDVMFVYVCTILCFHLYIFFQPQIIFR